MWGISWLAANRLAAQEGLYTVEWVRIACVLVGVLIKWMTLCCNESWSLSLCYAFLCYLWNSVGRFSISLTRSGQWSLILFSNNIFSYVNFPQFQIFNCSWFVAVRGSDPLNLLNVSQRKLTPGKALIKVPKIMEIKFETHGNICSWNDAQCFSVSVRSLTTCSICLLEVQLGMELCFTRYSMKLQVRVMSNKYPLLVSLETVQCNSHPYTFFR